MATESDEVVAVVVVVSVDDRVYVVACTLADLELWCDDPPPKYATDGSCAHPRLDPCGRCRLCGVVDPDIEEW